MREIDYTVLLKNINEMINTTEYDAMRSAGKCKMNADVLVNLHKLKDIYTKTTKTTVKTPKEGK